jgi:FtsH-binding integral membrane protein
VIWLHAATVVASIAAAIYLFVPWGFNERIAIWLACLAGHSLLRLGFRGGRGEAICSGILSLVTVSATGLLGQSLYQLGWPVLGVPISLLGATLYLLICGRDFSFVGQFVFAGVFTIAGCFTIEGFQPQFMPRPGAAILMGLAWLTYHVYDLAMILKRRRLNEPLCAATDLYGDLLNFFSYSVRAIHHWRLFKF